MPFPALPPFDWRDPGEGKVTNRRQRIDVAPAPLPAIGGILFRSAVSEIEGGGNFTVGRPGRRNAEAGQEQFLPLGDQQRLGGDPPVINSIGMNPIHRPDHRRQHLFKGIPADRPADSRKMIPQRFGAGVPFHRIDGAILPDQLKGTNKGQLCRKTHQVAAKLLIVGGKGLVLHLASGLDQNLSSCILPHDR